MGPEARDRLRRPRPQNAVGRRHHRARASVAQVTLDRKRGRIPLAATDLQRRLRHPRRHVRAQDLRLHERHERSLITAIAQPRCLLQERPGGTNGDVHVRQCVLNRRDLHQRAAIRIAARRRVLERGGQRGLRDPDVHRRQPHQKRGCDDTEHEIGGAARLADASVVVKPDTLELGRDAGVPAHPETLPTPLKPHPRSVLADHEAIEALTLALL
jgi:hypothetical protein